MQLNESMSPTKSVPARKIAVNLLAGLFCLGLVAQFAAAQTANATLTGLVKDQSGAAIPGSAVTATSRLTGEKRTMTTDQAGRYTIVNLLPGFYDLQAEKTGFNTTVIRNQEFVVDATVTEDFQLQPVEGGVPRIVEVQREAPAVETTTSSVQRVLGTREVDELPNLDRSAGSLSSQAPGAAVSGTGNAATITIGHSAAYQTGYILDGMPNQTGNQGNQYYTLAQDWIQEFSVMGLQYPAEYGNASGGVINSVTRSGGNQIHGRLYGFYRNQALNSNPSYYTQPTKAPFISSRIGAAVGGPLKKGKLFYYAGYENFHQSTVGVLNATALAGAFGTTAQPIGTPVSQLVPWLAYGNTTTLPTTSDTHIAMLKFDYAPSAKNHFTLRGNLDYEPAFQSGFGGKATAYTNTFKEPYGVMIGWTRTLSATTLNDFRLGYFQDGRGTATWTNMCAVAPVYPGTAANKEPYNFTTTESLGGPTIWGNPTGYYAGVNYNTTTTGGGTFGGSCGGIQNNNGNASTQDSVTMIRGAHEIKFGALFRHEDLWSRDGMNNGAGTYTMASSAGPFSPNATIAQNFTAAGFTAAEKLAPLSYLGIFNDTPGLTSFRFRYSAVGGFIQDFWKIRPNLTLNLGVRYDISNNNSELGKEAYPALEQAVPGSTGFIQPGFHKVNNDPLDIAPRFGFAWTPFKNKRTTVVRGGFGLFYNANDGASVGIYITGNAWAPYDYAFSANTATTNPYCIGNKICSGGIPAQYEIAVQEVLASALANFTLPQFPVSTSPCAATNTCTVAVGSNVYTIPALSSPYVPQGSRVDLDPHYRIPGATQATIGIQHQVGNSLTLSADYINHYGFNGIVEVNNNVALTGPGNAQTYTFVNPAITSGYMTESIATLKANDVQMKASYRGKHNVRVAVAYQYGYSDDNSLSNFAISAHSAVANNPFNLNYDYGPSTNDIRNTVVMNATIPLLLGVELSPIFNYASGAPYTATTSSQTPGTALAPANCQAYFSSCYPYANGIQYSRDSLRGDPTYGLNARLSKHVALPEHRSLTVLIEAFNIPSWRNRGTAFFTNVDATTGASAFGQPTNASNTLRQVQVGARLDF